jgi:uncharacterized protein (DUF1778 family)
MSEILKREVRSEFIKLRCTPREKETIQNHAASCGASTVSDYLLTLGLESNTQEYSSARRKANGILLSAEVYSKLFEIIEALQLRPDADIALVRETIALVHEVRREIVLYRQT